MRYLRVKVFSIEFTMESEIRNRLLEGVRYLLKTYVLDEYSTKMTHNLT